MGSIGQDLPVWLTVIASEAKLIHSFFKPRDGLLRGTCHRARIRATRWLAMTLRELQRGGFTATRRETLGRASRHTRLCAAEQRFARWAGFPLRLPDGHARQALRPAGCAGHIRSIAPGRNRPAAGAGA